jgi:hypothetical protein
VKLSERERKLLWLGLIVLVLGLAYRFWVGPLYEKKSQLSSQVKRLQQQEKDVFNQLVRYRELSRKEESFRQLASAAKDPGILLRTLESALGDLNLKKNLVSANPSQTPMNPRYTESILNVKLSRMKWQEMIQLLHKIEADGKGIWVKKARLIANKGAGGLDCEISLSAFLAVNGDGKKPQNSGRQN